MSRDRQGWLLVVALLLPLLWAKVTTNAQMVDLGVDGLFKRTRIRLAGVDAPNAYKAGPETTAGKIRDEIKKLTSGKCSLRLVAEGRGGWVAEVDVDTPTGVINLNSLLQDRGYVYSSSKT